MKRLLSVVFIFLSLNVLGQSIENLKPEDIKNSGKYFYGQSAICDTYEEAEKKARKAMFKNLAATSAFDMIDTGVDRDEQIEKIIESFKTKLENNKYIKVMNVVNDTKNDEYSCLVYLNKDDMKSLCDERADEMRRRFEIAQRKESEDIMDDALREYYWAMMICVAHPQGNKLKVDVNGENIHAYTYLYEHLAEVLETFDFFISKGNPGEIHEDGISVILNVRAFDKDVSNLRIKYHDGYDSRISTTVKNGKVQLELANAEMDVIDIQIEYDFAQDAVNDMIAIMDNIDKVVLKRNVARKEVKLKPYLQYFKNFDEIQPGEVALGTSLKENDKYYLDVMQNVETAFRAKNYETVRQYFTKEAYAMLDTLVRSAKISVVGTQEYKFLELDNRTICYDIDIQFEFKNHASFIREVVFRFDNNSKLISSLAFRLTSIAEEDIVSRTKWPAECRYALISFLEDYQTAYALKRYDYLESIFSDDALIIVGHVVEKAKPEQLMDRKVFNMPMKQVNLMRENKDQYFERLSRVFKKQEYIDIKFTETEFTKQKSSSEEDKKGEDIFGVQLLQKYNSTSYGDEGYLFLMVDLRDKSRPVIHVRAWQSEKTELKDLVGLKDVN